MVDGSIIADPQEGEQFLPNYYSTEELQRNSGGLTASAAEGWLKHSNKPETGTYDVFLSHSFRDALVILGIRNLLLDQGLRVYVDWIDDPQLDRARVSASTAAQLRAKMQQSKSLVYATSRMASRSRWMPWELGYFDGYHSDSHVSILPVETGVGETLQGEEYLGLYKSIEKIKVNGIRQPYVVTATRRHAESLASFVNGLIVIESVGRV